MLSVARRSARGIMRMCVCYLKTNAIPGSASTNMLHRVPCALMCALRHVVEPRCVEVPSSHATMCAAHVGGRASARGLCSKSQWLCIRIVDQSLLSHGGRPVRPHPPPGGRPARHPARRVRSPRLRTSTSSSAPRGWRIVLRTGWSPEPPLPVLAMRAMQRRAQRSVRLATWCRWQGKPSRRSVPH